MTRQGDHVEMCNMGRFGRIWGLMHRDAVSIGHTIFDISLLEDKMINEPLKPNGHISPITIIGYTEFVALYGNPRDYEVLATADTITEAAYKQLAYELERQVIFVWSNMELFHWNLSLIVLIAQKKS